MIIFDKINLILGVSLIGLILIFFFVSYLIIVTLEQNNIKAYSMMGIYWILNIGKLKSITHKDPTARFLYFSTYTILILMGLIILYFILMILIFGKEKFMVFLTKRSILPPFFTKIPPFFGIQLYSEQY